jgi:hypothetical protein
MYARDPAEAAEVLNLLLKFFGDGERWAKGRLSDRRGNRCLVGALDFVSSHHAIRSEGAERYLADEISAAGDCPVRRRGLRQVPSQPSPSFVRGTLSGQRNGPPQGQPLRF